MFVGSVPMDAYGKTYGAWRIINGISQEMGSD